MKGKVYTIKGELLNDKAPEADNRQAEYALWRLGQEIDALRSVPIEHLVGKRSELLRLYKLIGLTLFEME